MTPPITFQTIKHTLYESAAEVAYASVIGAGAAAAFWLLSNLEPIRSVACVAGATTALNFGLALVAYSLTYERLSVWLGQYEGEDIRLNVVHLLAKTAAISLASLALTGSLSLPAFVATGLLTEAYCGLCIDGFCRETLIGSAAYCIYKKVENYLDPG